MTAQGGGNDPRIRDAASDDIAAITAIYAEHVRTNVATFEETPPDEAEMSARLARLTNAGLPWLVMENDGSVIGYAYAGPFRERSAYRFAVEDSIYLDTAATGQGYGTLLLGELIARCQALGKRQMIAVIGGSTTAASIALHSRLGFRVAGVLPSVGYKLGNWADTVMMTRALGDGDSTPPE